MSCSCGKTKAPACAEAFQFAVKAVCGSVAECRPEQAPAPVAPGSYYTAINIHNPSKCDTAQIRWKVAEALPLNVEKPPAKPRD